MESFSSQMKADHMMRFITPWSRGFGIILESDEDLIMNKLSFASGNIGA